MASFASRRRLRSRPSTPRMRSGFQQHLGRHLPTGRAVDDDTIILGEFLHHLRQTPQSGVPAPLLAGKFKVGEAPFAPVARRGKPAFLCFARNAVSDVNKAIPHTLSRHAGPLWHWFSLGAVL